MTTLLNNFADQLVMGDKSNFNAMVQLFMTQEGLSEEEAVAAMKQIIAKKVGQ